MSDTQTLKKAIYESLFGNEGSMTMQEFTDAFEAIVEQILAFETSLDTKNKAELKGLKDRFAELSTASQAQLSEIQQEAAVSINKALERIAIKVSNLKDGKTPTDKKLITLIKPLIPAAKNGETPTDTKLRTLIKPLIPAPIPGSPDKGSEIVDKINADKSKKKIKKEHLEGYDMLEEMVRTAVANSQWRGGGSFVYDYDYSSVLDGVTKTFTLPSNARVIAVFGSSTPGVFRKTTDYTTTASTLTFTSQIDAASTLAAGQTLILLYKII